MPKDLNAEMNRLREIEEAAMRASLKPQKPPKLPGKKKDLNAEMNRKRAAMEKAMRATLKPDSLIAPNSSVRGSGCGCKCGKGIVVDNKSSGKDGLKRIAPAPGWGSNANGQYDPSPPALPNF